MKETSTGLYRIFLTTMLLWQTATLFAATEITVNSANNTDVADSQMTLTEALSFFSAGFTHSLTPAESAQVATVAGTTNRIKFSISGSAPFFITAPDSTASGALFPPILASDLIVDGYSQTGASPNNNSILSPNNAVIKIVIDSRTAVTGGEATFGVAGNNVLLRGLSLLGGADAIDFGNGALGGGIQGCWIGVSPDQSIVNAPSIGTYIYQSGGFQVIGTDGNGVNDRNEFNVFVGCKEMAIGVEADGIGTTDIRVSGNFIGVMPDGLHSMPASLVPDVIEGDALEGAGADNLIFGTDANGIADENERNIVAGLTNNGSRGCEALQLWGKSLNVKVMGNYFGVGIDGVTPLGNKRFFSAEEAPTTAQIGSDGDGTNDVMEANIIANHSEYLFRFGGPTSSLVFRRNSFFGNTVNFFNDPENSFNAVVLGLITPPVDLAAISPVISNVTTRAELVGWVPVSGDPNYPVRTNAQIHIYQADSSAAADRPQGKKWLATYVDNGPEDLDSRTNYFRFNICSLPISSTGAQITVHETVFDELGGGSSLFATALSLPDVSNALSITHSGGSVTLTWQMNGVLETNTSLKSPGTWGNVPGCSPVTLSVGTGHLYFRVAQ